MRNVRFQDDTERNRRALGSLVVLVLMILIESLSGR